MNAVTQLWNRIASAAGAVWTGIQTSVKTFPKRFAERVRKRTIVYWLFALAFLFAAAWIDRNFEDGPDLLNVRYWLFGKLTQLEPSPLEPSHGKIIEIGDAEFYSRQMDYGRSPANRNFIATLMYALDAADAPVIALDFDFSMPSGVSPDTILQKANPYAAETDALMKAVADIAQRRPIVLPRRLWYGEDYPYTFLPDLLEAYGICSKLDSAGRWSNPGTAAHPLSTAAQHNIYCGYVDLPDDLRTLPQQVRIGPNTYFDSLALATAKLVSPDAIANHILVGRYVSAIPMDTLNRFHTVIPAQDLLRQDPAVSNRIRHSGAVFVGGGWHRDGGRDADQVDLHNTPLGPTTGLVIHENFLEAMLANKQWGFVSPETLHALEIVFGLLAIIVFAGLGSFLEQLIALVALSAFLLLVQFLMFVAVGTFFEAFVPLFGIWLHTMLDRLFGMRERTESSAT